MDGTLIHAWAGHKSMRRKHGSDDERPPKDWHGERRGNDSLESTSDPDSRLYRKSHDAPALPSYLWHVLTDNLHAWWYRCRPAEATATLSGTCPPRYWPTRPRQEDALWWVPTRPTTRAGSPNPPPEFNSRPAALVPEPAEVYPRQSLLNSK